MSGKEFGRTVPRIWTKPLRDLNPRTSLGFELVDFAQDVLGMELRPWQKWLAVHALELMPDGSYRFRRVLVEIARQQGKTTLASVLACWWLHVDALRHPDRVPPVKFKIVGTAQNLDIAREPWQQVKLWCDPDPVTAAESELANPALQSATAKVSDTNGKEYIQSQQLAQYEIRAAKNARGKPAARVLMDELREQQTWAAWNATSQTTKSFWSGQLWGLSNAGDYTSVVLAKQRDAGLAQIRSWDERVENGGESPESYADANPEKVDIGLFEWSAPDGCALDDPEAILQANPSIGYGGLTVSSIASEAQGMTEAGFRTECLCQWVTADIIPYLNPKQWARGIDDTSRIPDSGRVVLGIDTSSDRATTYISAAGLREDGLPHVECIARRDGMLWVTKYLRLLKERWPDIHEIAIQSKGCPAVDFIDPLTDAGWTVHMVEGFKLGASCGRFKDRVREGKLRHPPQPAIEQQVAVAVTRRLGEVEVWDRTKSAMQTSGLIAESQALYALETSDGEPEKPKYQPSTGIKVSFA